MGIQATFKHGMRATLACGTILALAGCSAPEGDPSVILSALSEANSVADSEYAAHTLRESMPNQAFRAANGRRFQGSESVVIGTVASAEVSSSHSVVDESVVDVPVGSPDAMWSMASVEVDVDEAWGELAGRETVTFSLPIRGGNVRAQVASIRSLGKIVVFLTDGRVARNEALLGLVADDGRITFPVAGGSDDSDAPAGPFFGGIDSVSELREALSRGARSEIRLDESGQRVGS